MCKNLKLKKSKAYWSQIPSLREIFVDFEKRLIVSCYGVKLTTGGGGNYQILETTALK